MDQSVEMTDAGLLAEATVWAATTPARANQAFNINNGDLFRWQDMWPVIVNYFELETAHPLPMSLDVVMADKEPVWDAIVERQNTTASSPSTLSARHARPRGQAREH